MNKATINFNLSLHLVDLLVKQKPLNCLSNDLSSNQFHTCNTFGQNWHQQEQSHRTWIC